MGFSPYNFMNLHAFVAGFQYGSPNSGVTKKMLSIMRSMKEFPSVRYHSMNLHQLVSPLLNRDIAMC